MNRRKILSLALALVMALSLLPVPAGAAGDVGTALPPIIDEVSTVAWSATTAGGETITQRTYEGKTQVLIFFQVTYKDNGTRCGNSERTIREIVSRADLANNKNVQIIAIGVPSGVGNDKIATAEDLQSFMTEFGLKEKSGVTLAWMSNNDKMFSYINQSGVEMRQFAITFVLDNQQHIRAAWSGSYTADYYASVLEQLGVAGVTGKPQDYQLYNIRVADPAGFDPSEELSLLNAYRTSNGLGELAIDAQLQAAAMQRAAEISIYYSHTRPNNSGCFTAVKGHGSGMAENIAAGQTDVEMVMSGWINSEGHRKNIETPSFQSVGLGCFTDSNGTKHWVQMFSNQAASGSYRDKSVYVIAVARKMLSLSALPASLTMEIGEQKTVALQNTNQGFNRGGNSIYVDTIECRNISVADSELNDDGTVTVIANKPGNVTIRLGITGTEGELTVDVPVTVTKPDSDFVIDASGKLITYVGAGGDVTIPDGVISIGKGAFRTCHYLTSVTIPVGVTSIGDYAFASCHNLTDVTIPEGVVSIGSGAFDSCDKLTSMTIPASLTTIGAGPFAHCSGLTDISVASGNECFITQDGVLFNKEKTTLAACPGGKNGSYIVPSGVTSISAGAFEGCDQLTSVTIPEGVISIGDLAFEFCEQLTSITIPDSITSIPDGMFWNCSSLVDVIIPNSVTSIGMAAFTSCGSLTSVTIPAGVTSIGPEAFKNCENLKTVKILSKTAVFGSNAFDFQNSSSSSAHLTIYGYARSSAEVFCGENNIPFSLLSEPTPPDDPKPDPGPSESPEPTPVAVTGVSVDKTASVQVGKSATLAATVKPSNAGNKGVYWTSDDTRVVTVDRETGKLTGIKEGKATVTVTTLDGGFTATCTVTVTKASSSGGGGGSSSGGGSGSSRPSGGGGGGSAAPKPTQPQAPASEQFADVVKDSWYEAGISFVVEKGLFQGIADKTFAPHTNMTRAMLMTVLARLDGQDTEGGATWYAKGMDWAKAQGISDGTMPQSSVTREQMVTMLYRYAKAAAGTGDLGAFVDGANVSPWAREAMTWAVSQGILTGKGGQLLDPQGTATRAEVATILQRFVGKK